MADALSIGGMKVCLSGRGAMDRQTARHLHASLHLSQTNRKKFIFAYRSDPRRKGCKFVSFAHKLRALNSVNSDYFFTLITYGTDLITPLENSVLVSAYTASSSAFETFASLTCTSLS